MVSVATAVLVGIVQWPRMLSSLITKLKHLLFIHRMAQASSCSRRRSTTTLCWQDLTSEDCCHKQQRSCRVPTQLRPHTQCLWQRQLCITCNILDFEVSAAVCVEGVREQQEVGG